MTKKELLGAFKRTLEAKLHVYVCDSSSGRGHHVFCFLSESLSQEEAKTQQTALAQLMGLRHDPSAHQIICPFAKDRPLIDSSLKETKTIQETDINTLKQLNAEKNFEYELQEDHILSNIPEKDLQKLLNANNLEEFLFTLEQIYPTQASYRQHLSMVYIQVLVTKYELKDQKIKEIVRSLCQRKGDHEYSQRIARLKQIRNRIAKGLPLLKLFHGHKVLWCKPQEGKDNSQESLDRVMCFLALACKYGSEVLSARYISGHVGVTATIVNRTLQQLSKKGIISRKREKWFDAYEITLTDHFVLTKKQKTKLKAALAYTPTAGEAKSTEQRIKDLQRQSEDFRELLLKRYWIFKA